VDPDKSRYAVHGKETVGDWYLDSDGSLHIEVSPMCEYPNDDQDVLNDAGFLIALHELIEAMLCLKRGITQQTVDMFDFEFSGKHEPGDDADSPYRREHRFACMIEHLVAHELGMTGYGTVE
jgi:hypothetical protein